MSKRNDVLMIVQNNDEKMDATSSRSVEEAILETTSSRSQVFRSGVKKLGKLRHGFMDGVRHVRNRKGPAQPESLSLGSSFLSLQDLDNYQQVKFKTNRRMEAADFEEIHLIQELNECRGAISSMKWSLCGQLLAVAGQDQILKVYCSHKAWKHFTDLIHNYHNFTPNKRPDSDVDASSSLEKSSFENDKSSDSIQADSILSEEGPLLLFAAYRGHTAEISDISWSKKNFLLSSSMDKTIRLWHVTRVECLAIFCRKDYVTTVNFHPEDDYCFLCGRVDGYIELWDTKNKKLTAYNKVMAPGEQYQEASSKSRTEANPPNESATASAFIDNGERIVVGTFDGRIIFYSSDQLKYLQVISVVGSKNFGAGNTPTPKKGRHNKINGIEAVEDKKILVTTSDSRILLYDLKDYSLLCEYKGFINYSSRIRATVSPDSKYIICGSENSSFYIWRFHEKTLIGERKDKNNQWECVCILSPGNVVESGIIISALFAPNPNCLEENAKYVIAIADYSGSIKLFAR